MIDKYIANIQANIVNPILALLFALAFIYFLYGAVKFMSDRGNENTVKEGQSHLMYGIIGLFIIVSAFGILNFIAGLVSSLK